MSIYLFPGSTPEQVAASKVAAILENSNQHFANVEAARIRAELKVTEDSENERIAAQHLAVAEAERRREAERLREENRQRSDAEMRSRFFAANPDARESDFTSMLPELRKAEMLKNFEASTTAEALVRNSGSYGVM